MRLWNRLRYWVVRARLERDLAEEMRLHRETLEDRFVREGISRSEARLAAGTYGLSIESGKPIPDERLEAIPTAERTAEEEAH